MKLRDKKIAFGLTSCFYTFKNTIAEMKNITLEGGKIIPIMQEDTYNTDSKYGKALDFTKQIEKLSNKKIITSKEELEKIKMDITVIAPCSRNPHCKTCKFYI